MGKGTWKVSGELGMFTDCGGNGNTGIEIC